MARELPSPASVAVFAGVQRPSRRSVVLAMLSTAFFLSGAAALSYQVAWQRILGLLGGADSLSAALVVSAFLLGLGLGSLAGALLADRLGRRGALLAFAACETATAALAVGSVPVLHDFVLTRLATTAPGPLLLFATSFATLLPPTLLMGMTLPFLARAAVTGLEGAPLRLGLLYGANTAGAAVGALLAGTLLVGVLGYHCTVLVGCVLNGLIALSAGLLALQLPSGRPVGRMARPAAPMAASGRRRLLIWCAAVALSGFLAVALQLVWVRVLGAMMQSRAVAFPLILAGFLAADAAGLFLGGWLARRLRDPFRSFLLIQGTACMVGIGGLLLLQAAGPALAPFFTEGSAFGEVLDVRWRSLVYAGLVALAVCPAALLLGMTFPLTQAGVQDDLALVGRRVGLIQLANIVGNAVGGLVAGLVLLHWLGSAGTLVLLAALAAALTLVAFAPRYRWGTQAVVAGLLLLAALIPDNSVFWARLHGAGTARVAEDRTAVAVIRPQPQAESLYVGGKWQSDALPFRPVQAAMGLTAAFAAPGARDALLIGLGSGGTLHGLLTNPALERIRVVELAKPVLRVVEASAATVLQRILADPRLELRIADGRHALFTDTRRYDVIVAETISPRSSHSGLLYSVEFFQQIRARLRPGGIVVQWAATPRTEATFQSVFPHGARIGHALLGSDKPITVSATDLTAIAQGPAAPALRTAGVDPAAVADWFLARPQQRWDATIPRRDTDLNTDLHPRDEYGAPYTATSLSNGRTRRLSGHQGPDGRAARPSARRASRRWVSGPGSRRD